MSDVDYQKITQALNYLAHSESGGIIQKLKALKLLFFADRYHLRHYGRSVTEDSYFAMQFGPAASLAKDVADGNSSMMLRKCDSDKEVLRYAAKFIRPIEEPDGKVNLFAGRQGVDLDQFSDSDIEALDFAIENYGKMDGFALAAITHLYPEWLKHRDVVGTRNAEPMDYQDFFENPDPELLSEEGIEVPHPEDQETLEYSKEIYLQNQQIAKILT